jgi:hypothetical protein
MSSNDKQQDIRYTTDGTEPDAHSFLYTKPFMVKDPLLIKSRVFQNGKHSGAMAVSQFLLAHAPVITADADIFIDSQKITLVSRSGADKIYYTLDGSIPTRASYPYNKAIVLKNTTTIKARRFFNSDIGSDVAIKVIMKVKPHAAVNDPQGKSNKGLNFTYYEGSWVKMPVFKNSSAKKSGVVPGPDLKEIPARENDYGIEFSGLIEVPSTGVYSFYTISDDGSQLYVDNEKVVDNDGQHGDLEKTGRIALNKGKHPFRVLYFQSTSGINLKTYIEGPGLEKQEIPALLFSHK